MARGNGGRWRWWAGLGALAVVVGLLVWWLPSAFYPQARPPTVTAVRAFLIAVVVAVGAGLGLAGGMPRGRRTVGWGLWSALIAAGTVAVGLVVWKVPPALYATSPESGRAQAIALTRTGVLTAAAGLLVLANLLETRRATNLTHTREREAQLTERYTRAVDQLGSDTLDVRLGGIYALERLARDSPPDQPTIVEVLSAFVREHTTPGRAGAARRTRRTALPTPAERAGSTPARSSGGLDTDIQAALTVLGRLPTRPALADAPRADLTGAQLTDADLYGANLTDAMLGEADLSGARLTGADLSGAQLGEADLIGTVLIWANLSGAQLHRADLTGADMEEANLTDALLAKANLTDAWLVEANLTRAWLFRVDLTDAVLEEANLTDAKLFGADLTSAKELTPGQLDAAQGDASTVLPAGWARPTHWPERADPPIADA